MKGNKGRFRPAPWLAVLAAAALVGWGGLTLWLHNGRQGIALTLHDQIADASQLEGFTLSGQMGWNRYYDLLHFTLQDGKLDTRMELDAPAKTVEAGRNTRFSVTRSYVVPPEDRDAVNGAASITGTSADGSRFLSAPVDSVYRMYTLRFPDDTVIRLAAGETAPEEYATVFAALYPLSSDVYELNTDYDYAWTGNSQEPDASWPYQPTSGSCFVLGAGYGVCWASDYLGRAPGLYRAHSLTADEIAALPRDGILYDREVLCASTELGSLEPFYCPEDAAEALAGVSMADGSTLLLYRTAEGTLCADLVNAAGKRTDHKELATLDDWTSTDMVTLLPRTTDSEAILTFDTGNSTAYKAWLVLLRVENGTFTMADLVEDKDLIRPDAAALNAAGDKILLAKGELVRTLNGTILVTTSSQNGIALQVYELDTGHMTYMGRILTGSERDWARFYQTRLLHADRFITFDTLQKDGGTLP